MRAYIYTLSLCEPYRLTDNWTTETYNIVSEHFAYLQNLTAKGIAVLVGRTDYAVSDEFLFGIVVFEAENESHATHIMQNDPCLLNGVMAAKLHPFNIALLRLETGTK